MALPPCLPRTLRFDADELSGRIAASPTEQNLESSRSYDRCAVRLNVPTVAALRRQTSLNSSRKTWTTDTHTMPMSAGPLPLAASSNTYTSFLGGEGDNVQLKGPNTLSSTRPPSRSQQPLTHRATNSSNPTSASRRGSLKSESAESSPTTTISTVDSSLTEPSPSSSPESPTGLVPLTSFSSLSKTNNPSSEAQEMDRHTLGLPAPPPFGFEQTESPNKKGRNVRNLCINTNGIRTARPATAPALKNAVGENSTASLPAVPQLNAVSSMSGRLMQGAGAGATTAVANHTFSEPASPSFIVPSVPRPRKSKLNLTISTSDSSGSSSGGVPATPAFAPQSKAPAFGNAFSHLSSMREDDDTLFSPSEAPAGGMKLPPFGRSFDAALPTPGRGPEGGMSLPPFAGNPDCSPQRPSSRLALSIGRKSFEGGAGSTVVHQTIEHNSQVPLHDLPLSREVKSPSYPHGPACIYPPNVFLYHQPTCEEAREFDLIINVAREVANPFEIEKEEEAAQKVAKGYMDSSVQCDLLPAPPLSLAFEEAPSVSVRPGTTHDDEPDTPKASSPRALKKMPEYIHLPWEHNSNVYTEWLHICETIDKWASEGKKVLIHCQLGVSRSASLIVAYGLYKNPNLSPDEAREQAKQKSKWIDLNMHFMYELGDFKKILAEEVGPQYAARRPAGPVPLARAKTDYFVHGSHEAEEYQARRASSGNTHTKSPETIEEDRGPESAFPGTSTLPFGRDAVRQLPSPAMSMDLPLRSAHPAATKSESESSNATTPVQADKGPERVVPKRTKTSDSDKTVKLDTVRNSPETSPPPPIPSDIVLSPSTIPWAISSTFISTATPVRAIQTPPNVRNDSPHFPSPTPPRRLRLMPSLPAGFNSLRRISPALSLNTNAPSPSFGLVKSTNRPAPAPANNGLNAEESRNDDAPQLPSLDLGSDMLMSPRSTEFVMNPFHRNRNSLAGDLAGADFLMSPGAQERDPRSPPVKIDGGITRNIDDVL
ncbi:MAG: hypothetical protein MMC23_000453 [Stictis urceolatum]|nr:hypothetical protein [Stictis urceolata]